MLLQRVRILVPVVDSEEVLPFRFAACVAWAGAAELWASKLRHEPAVKKLEAFDGISTCSFELLHFVLLVALQYWREAVICSQLLVSQIYTARTLLVEEARSLQTWRGMLKGCPLWNFS
jgi:hypothetical protein